MNELALTESASLRAEHADRVDVLDKVKALSLLPDGTHVDLPMIARYYEVSEDAIESVIRRNRLELEANGFQVLKGQAYREFASVNLTDANPNARSITLFSRRAILNVGQMLVESSVARSVRTYLLDVEELAPPEVRTEAVERAALARVQILAYKAAEGLLERSWLATKAKIALARMAGEEPEIDPDDVPLYIPDFLKAKGLKKRQIESEQSWFGKRAAALYEAEHGEKPGKRSSDTPNGSVRSTLAWTQRDLPIFEEVWDRWYAAKYAPQAEPVLFGGVQ
ncbi:hypothetical protein ABT340_41335 [Streptosporangium sp. NPDC000239]|uniref:hypothetical protein n=1 Tax=Streptosporangium sp. NPDC000239 TaxID=3154248 RepID=UPI0033257394